MTRTHDSLSENIHSDDASKSDAVETAVDEARHHINLGVTWRVACWSALVGGGLALVLGLIYAGLGQRVPFWVYAVGVASAGLLFAAGWVLRRVDHHEAAARLDDEFCLADGVSTARGLRTKHRGGGFSDLQQRWTEKALAHVEPARLRPRLSRGLAVTALVLPVTAVLLGFRPPSDAVLEARAEAVASLALGEHLNQGIRDEVKRHLDQSDEIEKELLDPESFEELAEKLKISEERTDLMRQYAEMERNLAEHSKALQQKRAERLMDEAASRLSDNASSMALAEALRQKRYDDAADLLKQMQPDANADLNTQKQQIDKLKAAASHMSQAAKSFKASNKSGAGQSDLADQMATLSEQLDAQAQQYDDTLKKATNESKANSQLSEETKKKLGQCQSQCNSSSSELQKALQKLNASRKAGERLNAMRNTLAQCQGAVAGQCESPFSKAGGKKAGSGTADSRNDTFTPEDGQLDAITGQKSAGPSQTMVEEASSGTGVSGRRAADTTADHARQFESFVDRPDIPEPLKQGVKTYFESLHEAPEETLTP